MAARGCLENSFLGGSNSFSGVGTWLNFELESTVAALVGAGFKLTVSNLELLGNSLTLD